MNSKKWHKHKDGSWHKVIKDIKEVKQDKFNDVPLCVPYKDKQ